MHRRTCNANGLEAVIISVSCTIMAMIKLTAYLALQQVAVEGDQVVVLVEGGVDL